MRSSVVFPAPFGPTTAQTLPGCTVNSSGPASGRPPAAIASPRAASSGTGAFAFIGLGLLVGARARTVEAANGIASAINVPMMLLGGVFFAIDDVPAPLAPLVRALPLTYLCDGLRKVMNEGATLSGVGLEIAVLLAWGVATLLAAVRLFRWE